MLFDMHVHSAEVSPCSTISAVDIVREYKNKGYDGIVLTDHFLKYYMEVSFKASFEEYCRLHHEGYLKAKEEGEKLGFAVLYGCELRLNSTGNSDYLLYGITHEFLAANPDIFTWKVNKLKEKADENGFFVYQAHPFRDVMVIANPANLTGMEVLNGKETDPLRSEFSELWADRYNLHIIAKVRLADLVEVDHYLTGKAFNKYFWKIQRD